MKTETKIIIGVGLITIIIVVIGVFFLSKESNQPLQTSTPRINAGSDAPNFNMQATTGEKVALADYKGKKNVLLYFHEGLTCDPCMQQIPELEKSLDQFDKLNVQVLAISSGDGIDKLKESLGRYGIKKIPVISYDDASIDTNYDLTRFSMGMSGRPGHTFVLVGTDGKILWRKDYWPGYGMMVQGGTMFVNSSEVISEVKKVLKQ